MANNMLLRFATQRVFLAVVFVFAVLALFASFRSLPRRAAPESSLYQPPQQHESHRNNKPAAHPPSPNVPKPKPPPEAYSPKPDAAESTSNARCDAFAGLPKDTQIVIKTGANEVFEKLPTQMLTALECYNDILIFSDLKQKVGPYVIHDALDNVTESVKKSAKEFDYYRKLQEYKKDKQEISLLKEKTGKDAWNLDKFKFLHMLEKTWAMRPDKKWYVFIEADTYLIQTNLILWLEKMDHKKPLYLGSPTYFGGDAFSHGGSGYILSGTALAKFAKDDEGVAQRYDEKLKSEQYGDLMLMKALKDKGVEFSRVWPMLQAEKPSGLPFGSGPDSGVRHWCQPIVTMHHITPDESSMLWEFEGQRKDITKPLLIEELFRGVVSPNMEPIRSDWYNLSDDIKYRGPGIDGDRQKPVDEMSPLEKKAYSSFEACGKACEEQERCMQYVYSDKMCGFSYSFRLGHKRFEEDGKTFKSGFMLEKIKGFEASNKCKKPEWILPS